MEDSRNRNLDVKDLVNTGLSNTEGNLYLVAEKTLERMEIQFIPTEMEIDPAPDIAAVVIVGRNEPRYQHIAGQTVLRMTLDFYADDERRVEAIEKARWLQTMVARNGTTEAPQRLKLIFGDLFRDEMWIVKRARQVNSLFDKRFGYLPRLVRIDLEMALDIGRNLQWRDIR